MNETTKPAVEVPLDAPVRPAYLHAKGGGPAYPVERVAQWPKRNAERMTEPLYDQAWLDAAVAAERERWTMMLTEKWHGGDGKGQTLAQYMGMKEDEYAAWVLGRTRRKRPANWHTRRLPT